MSIQFFCPFSEWLVWSFDIELDEQFVYFGYLPLVSCIICKYFLPFHRLCFWVFLVSFAVQKFLSLIRADLFIFAFISFALGDRSKKILLWFVSKCVLPMFSTRSFNGFRSLNHFEFTFVYGVMECSNLIILHVAVQFCQHHFKKKNY